MHLFKRSKGKKSKRCNNLDQSTIQKSLLYDIFMNRNKESSDFDRVLDYGFGFEKNGKGDIVYTKKISITPKLVNE